jgi:hypothetical protein
MLMKGKGISANRPRVGPKVQEEVVVEVMWYWVAAVKVP